MSMFDAGKTRMIGLFYGEKDYDDMLSRFHLIPERNGQTDGQICYINIAHHYAERDKNGFSPDYIFCLFLNAVWALTIGGFRIVSDALVNNVLVFLWLRCEKSAFFDQ